MTTRLRDDRSRMTREKFCAQFVGCCRCGLVKDLRTGKYLSERDARELESICVDYHPRIPNGDLCGFCEDEMSAKRLRRFA